MPPLESLSVTDYGNLFNPDSQPAIGMTSSEADLEDLIHELRRELKRALNLRL
jgi:hypothetical protein